MLPYIGYARYSSENQRESSIEDQHRNILRRYMEMGVPANQVTLLGDKAIRPLLKPGESW